MVEKLIKTFYETFGEGGEVRTYFAPGRVNLIGEHTDYNGGHVFPCALTLGTYGIVRDREDRMLRLYSVNIDSVGIVEVSLDEIAATKEASWTNYPKGVVWAFEKRGFKMAHGMDILIYGDIPNGSGLSSSASLEVLTGVILKDTFGFDVSMVDIALIGQDAENNFNGCNCGIMDQFASAMGKKDNAIFLDTNTLNYTYAPVKLPDAKIVITNSKVKHSLVNSAYNDRRNECETALKELQAVVDIKTLGDLTEEQFEEHKGAVKDEVRRKRAKHAVYENQKDLYHTGDRSGPCLRNGHRSQRRRYAERNFRVSQLWYYHQVQRRSPKPDGRRRKPRLSHQLQWHNLSSCPCCQQYAGDWRGLGRSHADRAAGQNGGNGKPYGNL